MESMSDDERTSMRQKWRSEYDDMSEEDKATVRKRRSESRGGDREAMRERWNAMSDDERTAAKERRRDRGGERQARWDSMSDEERATAREKRGQHKGQSGDGRQHHGGERGKKPE